MSNFIAYHSARVMGHEYSVPKDGHFRWWSGKSKSFLHSAIGGRVWAVTSKQNGGRTSFRLAGMFTATEIRQESGGFGIVGIGTSFQPPCEVTSLPWFSDLRREQNNFSFGFGRIRSESVVAELEKLLAELAPRIESPGVSPLITTHILVTQNDFIPNVIDADGTGAIIPWIIPKSGKVGDWALIYAAPKGIFARAKILSAPKPAGDLGWPGRYAGDVGEFRLLRMFAPLEYVRTELPDFGWPRYPRSFTTLTDSMATQLERVIAVYQKACSEFEPDNVVPTVEGARRLVYINCYERSHAAREACKHIHGTSCVICGFDFGAVYGSGFQGFIHVHHLRPLAEIGREYVVDPQTDLVPVCPNCHAVVHSESPPLSIDGVRKLLKK
jgi:hypothetical protein